jgi:hypothetical protein
MTARRVPAFAFWLDYLDSRGGLWEQTGDTVLAVLPEQLADRHDLPESTLITDDPDIAREDGVLFLGAGHPEIDKAADAVVDAGDVAALTLPHSAKPVSREDLLARIRERVPVDHGRIDAAAAPIRTHRPVLRLEAMVSHTVSAEERFTEVAECMIDVASRIAWPEDSAKRLRDPVAASDTLSRTDVRANDLVPVLAVAHRVLDDAAAARGRILAAHADAERATEIVRTNDYYAAALATIDKRRSGADPKRAALLEARAQATIAERDRRLAEIDEKYRHRHTLRPYRLHMVNVPAWRLATDVRRGDRRWPLTFDYLPILGTVAPVRCPACDAHAPLVATKAQLGCTACVPAKAPAPATRVTPPPSARKPATRPASTDSDPVPTPSVPDNQRQPELRKPHGTRSARPGAPVVTAVRTAGPALPGKEEERKVITFWDHVAAGEHRKLTRLIAPDSPLAALIRLYGAFGPLYGIGVPAGHTPTKFTCGNYGQPVAGQRGGTAGTLHTRHDQYPYLLLWSPERLLEEIFPYSGPWHLGRATWFHQPPLTAPAPRVDLDPVAQLLLTHVTAHHGLTFTTRALAAWWRLPAPDDLLARFTPRVLAAALDRAVRYWSGATGATYPNAAKMFRADESLIRKATPLLQKHLQLNTTRNW